jgi:signal transduction histidine kinase/ligand-binding sensor domain-containing protein
MVRIFFILLHLLSAIFARDTHADSRYLVRIWQADEGLPGNVVRSIGQTPDGFLWVATAEGLARFNGLDFDIIKTGSQQSHFRMGFFRVFTPADGSVWVSTFHGGLFTVRADKLEPVIENEEKAPLITRLISHQGRIHFIRDQKVFTIHGDRRVSVVENLLPELEAALQNDLEKQLLRGRLDSKEPPTRLRDFQGGTWFLENDSLHHRAKDQTAPSPAIAEFKGKLTVNDLMEDREGNLWLASPIQGLIRIRHNRVITLATAHGIYQDAIQTGIRDRTGTWWLANRNGGVDRISDGTVTHLMISSSRSIRTISCIFEDRTGKLWFATRDASVFYWNGQLLVSAFSNRPELSKINAIAEDSLGRLWFGGYHGLWRWSGSGLEDFSANSIITGAAFSTLTLAPDGNLFAGTTDGRIFRYDGTEFHSVARSSDTGGRWISAILPLHSDEIWVSTLGAGLYVCKNSLWHGFGHKDGIPDTRLTTVTLTGEDALWMGSLGGIIHTSRSDLLLHRMNQDHSFPRWLRLDRSDGLLTRECVGGSQPGVFQDQDGTLWFPTPGGLAGIHPGKITPNPIPPTLVFKDAKINGLPYAAQTGSIIAGPGKVPASFHFTGLSLSAPEKVTYQVRLAGLEDHPRLIGNKREAEYPSIPPGQYTFEVSAMNGDGLPSSPPSTLSLLILPHFWQTAWFFTLCILSGLLLALSVGWVIARHRMKQKVQDLRMNGLLAAERSRISSDLHDDLGASLTELSILSEIATENPDDASLRSSLHQLSHKAKRVAGALDEIVWATNPAEDSLRSLVDYLSAFIREFLDTVQIPLSTRIERKIPDLTIGPRSRHNVLLAAREAVNNAVKHAAPQSIFLRITIADNQLIIQIQDDGIGFDVVSSTAGSGLRNLKTRMKDCGGDFRIESIQATGTTVTLNLPLNS